MMNNIDAKQQYKQVGKTIFVFALVGSALQIIVGVLKTLFIEGSLPYKNIIDTIFTFAPLYLVAFPISLIMFNKIPSNKYELQKIGLKRFIIYFIESVAIMYAGNIIGTLLSNILSKGEAINPVVSVTANTNLIQVLVITIVAPIIEEIIFRKQIIDHTIQYGEKISIIFSALTFGLFHMNFYQFFYAFGLGLIFGYIYVKTHSIKYSMIIHILLNVFGGVVAPYILSKIDINALENIAENINILSETEIMNMFIPFFILLVYAFVLIVFVIIGIILLVKNLKKLSFNTNETDIPKEDVLRTAYFNVYYVLFASFCLIMMIIMLII